MLHMRPTRRDRTLAYLAAVALVVGTLVLLAGMARDALTDAACGVFPEQESAECQPAP